MNSPKIPDNATPILPCEVYLATFSTQAPAEKDYTETLRGFVKYQERGQIYARMAKSTERYEFFHDWVFPANSEHFVFHKLSDNSVVTEFPSREDYESYKPYHIKASQ